MNPSSPSTPNEPTRFLPGAMIANRYRVVALLGRGGMGEVYRADDTKLGEAVALKFLPERLEHDESLRERLLGEARLARQVAHPNVCRVYDLGEVDGRLFLSMEYVDGEDLATLLRRIGRLPQEKAVQLAQQMCAGLQAAHEQGIVHRDLKPANVMLDGRGRARITDFGLAALASGVTGREAAAGTPAYMAPEQLLGHEVTVRSDVYALGLVLYELFTGRPAFEAHSWAEQITVKQSRTPSSPSQLAPGLDPLIERVILRCLLPDPNQRPASAAAVALALPGGDPLAAALAAGETPSPEMVAEAGGIIRFAPRVAWGWFACFLAGFLAMFAIAPHTYRIQQVGIAKPPAVLLDRAREVSAALGWDEKPRDEWSVLVFDDSQAAALEKRFGGAAVISHLNRFSGGTFRLHYRRSPRVLEPLNANGWTPSEVDPPLTVPGMLSLDLDGEGRLLRLAACPAGTDSAASGAVGAPVAWGRLFAFAGLDSAAFRAVTPEWTPPVFADRREAWIGRVPGDTALVLRLEAASFHGRPVLFRPVLPWTVAPAAAPPPARANVVGWLVWSLFLGLLALAVVTARKNLRVGSADTRGTVRMAAAGAVLILVAIWASSHWANSPQLFGNRVFSSLGRAGLLFFICSALYLTLEPIVRRTWPTVLVSWVRLLDGRFRDSLLARDVLAGLSLGTAIQVLGIAGAWAVAAAGGGHALPQYSDSPGTQTDALMSTGGAITVLLRSLLSALQVALSGAALAALFTQLTRRRLPSLVLAGLVMLLIQGPGIVQGWYTVVLVVVIIGVALFTMVRFGFVALLVFVTTQNVLSGLPLVTPGASWYWPATAVGVVVLGGLALWCLRSMLVTPPSAVSYDELVRTMRASALASRTPTRAASVSPATPADSQLVTAPSPPRGVESQTPTEYAPRPADDGAPPARD
jgi:serine/threonine-protein kinase